MGAYPDRCHSCKEPNIANLHYCAVCGTRFRASSQQPAMKPPSKKAHTKDQKLKMKKLKKKKELIELYKRKKITNDQFAKGMAKLGYSTDIEKAMEFKKYIRAQIQAFEKMDVSGAEEGGYHFDPNESKAQLPRDQFGNIITDFSVSPKPSVKHQVHHETYEQPKMETSRPPPSTSSSGGPLFGESLFGGGASVKQRAPGKEVPKATLKRDMTSSRHNKNLNRRRKGNLEWDEDDEEDEEPVVDEEFEDDEEEEFEINLEEGELDGESGWWDDDEWELDWSDEDEEDSEDWDWDEDEDDEWEMWEDEYEHPEGVIVEFEDDEEEQEDDEDVFDPRTYYDDEDEGEDPEDEEEDDDWGRPLHGRRRRK